MSNKEIFKQFLEVTEKKIISNSENYDKTLLSLSSLLLGTSLSFIKDVVSLATASHIYLLIVSWSLFGISIISTILSFLTGQQALKLSILYAEQYYIYGKEVYRNKVSPYAKVTNWLNYLSGSSYIIALGVTIVFVSINILERL